MAHFFIGSLVTTTFILVILYARKRNIHVTWWKWMLTVLGFLYAIFVLEVIVSFLDEGAGRAALIMGLALGFIAALFIRRPWCSYLCPLRPVTDFIRLARNWIREIWMRLRPKTVYE